MSKTFSFIFNFQCEIKRERRNKNKCQCVLKGLKIHANKLGNMYNNKLCIEVCAHYFLVFEPPTDDPIYSSVHGILLEL